MRDEHRDSISLPDRLAHVLDIKRANSSPVSAPSLLEAKFNNDMRQDSTGSYDTDMDSRSCRSLPSQSPGLHARERRKVKSRESRPKYPSVIETAPSNTSLMPQYDTLQNLEHSGRLLSRMPQKHVGSHLLHQVTLRPGARLSEIQEQSTARKIANLQRQNQDFLQKESPNDLLLFQEPSDRASSSLDVSKHDTAPSPAFCLRKRTLAPELSLDGISCNEDEGEEHTLEDFEGTIAGDWSSSSSSSSSGTDSCGRKRAKARWSDHALQQPSLHSEPTGFLFAFDRVLDCFDQPHDLDVSPQTLDTTYSPFVDDEIPDFDDDNIDWFLPCWHDDDLDNFEGLDESTIGEDMEELQSKGSLLDSDDSDSLVEKLFESLELESDRDRRACKTLELESYHDLEARKTPLLVADKHDWSDETVATEGDSTLNSTMIY